LGSGLAALDVLREEDVHVLAGEPWCRPEGAELAPLPPGQPAFLAQFTLRGREGLLPGLRCPGRDLEQASARRLPQLADERHLTVGVDGDDCDGARMLDDLALVLAPALERDRDPLAAP